MPHKQRHTEGMNIMEIRLGEKIKALRMQKNISQEVLVQVLSLSSLAIH